jgi:hypothetical protein
MGALDFVDHFEDPPGKICLTGSLLPPTVSSLPPDPPDSLPAGTNVFGQEYRSRLAVSAASDAVVHKEPPWHTRVLSSRPVYDKQRALDAPVQAFGHSFSPGSSSTSFLGFDSLRSTVAQSLFAPFSKSTSDLFPWAGLSGHVSETAPYAIALGALSLRHYDKKDEGGCLTNFSLTSVLTLLL